MPERDIIRMSIRELKRLKLVQEAIGKHVTQKAAADLMDLSEDEGQVFDFSVFKKSIIPGIKYFWGGLWGRC